MIRGLILSCVVGLIYAAPGCTNIHDPNDKINNTIKEKWHWGKDPKQNETAGYAQVVKAGDMIYISGIPANDLSPESISGLYHSLEECLKAFGASSKDVVKETLYTTDIEAMKKINDARKAFYKNDFPAATWVQVSRLYEPGAKVEVDLIAQVPGESH